MQELSFDHVFHLAGDQIIPNYMGVKLCNAPHHHLVATDKTASKLQDLHAVFADGENSQISPVSVSATEYPQIYNALSLTVDQLPGGTKIGFNITGGTKPMSAAALDLCRKKNITPFYIDTQDRQIRIFEEPFPHLAMPPVFESVTQFLHLAGYQVKKQGKTPDELLTLPRRRLLKTFWLHRERVRSSIADFAEATDSRYQTWGQPPACYTCAVDELRAFSASRNDRAYVIEHWSRVFPDQSAGWREAAVFAAGCWLEEWLLMQFHDKREKFAFLDLQQGLHLSVRGDVRKERDIQDVDVAFTDGYTLTLIECKSGRYDQEKVQKLENLRMSIGGAFGQGILAAINTPEDILADRIRLGSLSLVCGEALEQLPEHVAGLKQKHIYKTASDYRS